ncbi:hypothetical protein BGZ81_001511 [Podila clonocystis]|nr:hypothetical protein BGZ81_001511 [Podila clonocystis]
MKGTGKKVRRIYNDKVIVGFAGATADAFSLLDRFESKLEKHGGNLMRSAVELAKDWRTDRILRRLEAMLIVANVDAMLVLTGNGDVLDPETGVCAIGSGGSSTDTSALPSVTPTPEEIVSRLNQHIIGQNKAKRAVAVALRNRWRRQQVAEPLRQEITPKNILMIGPTGVGKTEIARRLAKLANAPFIKIEATKFTEVGYVGRDVDSIIRDLAEIAIKETRESEMVKVRVQAEKRAEERVLDILIPLPRTKGKSRRNGKFDLLKLLTEGERSASDEENGANASTAEEEDTETRNENDTSNEQEGITRQTFRERLRNGELDDKEIKLDLATPAATMNIMGPPGMEEMTEQIRSMFANMGGQRKSQRKVKIKEALRLLADEEAEKMLNEEDVKEKAIKSIEQHGIVFLDEIDKIASRNGGNGSGGEISRQGVQRDLLPLVEGTTVNTKYGMIKTDHILFIASGAFHLAKPSDLIPELQGRFPIRVELDSLSIEDFESILMSTDASLVKQYQALLATENVQLAFRPDGIKRLAEIAFSVNEKTENIGARRLYTVMEKLLEKISFSTHEYVDQLVNIDASFVDSQLTEIVKNEDLSRYIL